MTLFYTPPLKVVDLPADANHKGGFSPRAKQAIWLHSTVGRDSRAWLTTTPGSNASAHRLIGKDGTIYKLVPDDVAAWTEGPAVWYDPPAIKTNPNRTGLSIELENLNTGVDPYPVPQLVSCARQIVEWWGLYGWLPLIYHRYLQPDKSDPAGFPRSQFDIIVRDYLATVLSMRASS